MGPESSSPSSQQSFNRPCLHSKTYRTVSLTSILILSSNLSLFDPSVHSLRFHHQNSVCVSSLPIRATYFAHLILRFCTPSCLVSCTMSCISLQALPSVPFSLIPSTFQMYSSTPSANIFHLTFRNLASYI